MRSPNGKSGPEAEVWLAHASRQPAELAELRRADQRVPWVYLGQDYLNLRSWEGALGCGFQRVQIGRQLERAAGLSRRPFLDLMADLGRKHDSLAWWTSRVAERNTMVSPLFLYCCHLRLGLEQIEYHQGPFCVVSESWAVLRTLADEARMRNRRVRWATESLPRWRLRLAKLAQLGKRVGQFLRRRMALSRAARRIAPGSKGHSPVAGRPSVLLRTFVDEECLGRDGRFHDRHLPGLSAWLEGQGFGVWTVPVLFNLKRSYGEAWQWLHGNRQRFINPDDYLRLWDAIRALWVGLRQAFLPKGRMWLGSLEVTRLFDEDRLRFAFDDGSLEWLLMSRLPYRLKRAGFGVDLLIGAYENMIPEKGIIAGFRRYWPEVGIVGFQHTSLPPLLLSTFMTAVEARHAPWPDRVICNGRAFRDILVREGLDAGRVVEGPALRYAHLWQSKRSAVSGPDQPPCVLVALPLELAAAVELLCKVLRALGGQDDLPVKVKPHPMMNRDDLLAECGAEAMPGHFELVEGGMSQWLGRARVVVSAGSAVLYEALAAGVPVVTVGREGGLNLNPLGWLDGLDRVCCSSAEIQSQTLRLWNLAPDELAAYRRRGRTILRDSFNPVTEERMQVFVDGLCAAEHGCSSS